MRLWKNSKYINAGDVFLCDGGNNKYVDDAVKKGASLIVSELDDKYDVTSIKVDNVDDYLNDYYYDMIKDIKLIGVTGTNGKTTTCYLIYQMLNSTGIKTAYIGTIGCFIDNEKKALDNTTPSIDLLYNLILDAKEKDCKVVVMEVSSHALDQNRTGKLLFDAIGVTNVTKEHLDYHKRMKNYINCKRKILKELRNKKICILNKKERYYRKFRDKSNTNYIIGKDIKIKKINMNINESDFVFNDKKMKYHVRLSLVGMFNIYNFLMAYKIIKELGYDYNYVINNAINYVHPMGRMQRFNYQGNAIFIDYAHTPDAVLKVLKTVRKIKNNGLITIIGCGGNRDKEKRPIMGMIASKYSSYVIFTNDNPRYEDEHKIVKDMIKKVGQNYTIIYDRYRAIEKGISMLKDNMIIMILGKGHEDYQIIGNKKIKYSDIESVESIIKRA